MHLKQQWKRVHYYITKPKRQEVDFICIDSKGKPSIAIQVCMDISDTRVESREIDPLVCTAKYFNISENIIITKNAEKTYTISGMNIHAIPAWKFLLTI